VYTLSTCPWCGKTKKFFHRAQHSVRIHDYDLADKGDAGRIMRELTRRAPAASHSSGSATRSSKATSLIATPNCWAFEASTMNAGSRKKALRYFFGKLLSRWGSNLRRMAIWRNSFSARGEARGQAWRALLSLPAIRRDRMRDMQIVCPCIPFHRQTFRRHEAMLVRLFVHRDVTDPDSLAAVPEKEMDLE